MTSHRDLESGSDDVIGSLSGLGKRANNIVASGFSLSTEVIRLRGALNSTSQGPCDHHNIAPRSTTFTDFSQKTLFSRSLINIHSSPARNMQVPVF